MNVAIAITILIVSCACLKAAAIQRELTMVEKLSDSMERKMFLKEFNPKDLGELHNQFMTKVSESLMERPAKDQVEFDQLVFGEVSKLCLGDDEDECKKMTYKAIMQSKIDVKELFDNEGVIDFDSLYSEGIDDESKNKIKAVYDAVYRLKYGDISVDDVLAKINEISEEMDQKSGNELNKVAVQSVASIASGSTKFWTDVKNDFSHPFHAAIVDGERRRREIRRRLDDSNTNTSSSTIDIWDVLESIDWTNFIIADVFGAIVAVFTTGVTSLIVTATTFYTGVGPALTAVRYALDVGIAALSRSLETVGVSIPDNEEVLFCVLGVLFNTTNALFPECNSTTLFGPTGGELYDTGVEPTFFGQAAIFLIKTFSGVLPWPESLFNGLLENEVVATLATIVVGFCLGNILSLLIP